MSWGKNSINIMSKKKSKKLIKIERKLMVQNFKEKDRIRKFEILIEEPDLSSWDFVYYMKKYQ
jgi:hypothetical protein